MPYILSTMSTGVDYALYEKTPSGLTIVKKTISINGGANVMDKHFITPMGVVTKVSDADLELLNANPVFKAHKAAGYIKIQKTNKVETSNMEKKDGSAQPTAEDFVKKGKKAPVVAKKQEG